MFNPCRKEMCQISNKTLMIIPVGNSIQISSEKLYFVNLFHFGMMGGRIEVRLSVVIIIAFLCITGTSIGLSTVISIHT